jgi:sugar phosphate permease
MTKNTPAAAPAPHVGTARDPGLYPWLIALTGMFALFVSNGMTATGITIFDPALLKEFGWGRGDFKFRDTLNLVVAGLVAPIAGYLIDRVNPKYLMMTGFSLLTLGYIGYSQIANGGPVLLLEIIAAVTIAGLCFFVGLALRQWFKFSFALSAGIAAAIAVLAYVLYTWAWMGSALKQVYMIHLLFALVLSTSGSMVVIFLVSSWFVRHRGLAIGIALVGTSLGSAVLPYFNPDLIAAYGWRQSYVYNAIMPVVFLLFVWLIVKGTPRHAGTSALGQSDAVPDLKQHGLTYAEATRTRTFWLIAASGFLTYFAIFSFVQHVVLHANLGFGMPLKEAGKLMGIFSLVAMASKLLSGAVADRVDRHKVFTACFAIMLVGVIGLASMRQSLLLPAAVTIAVGWGGLFTLYNMLAVNNFGLREIGRINGSISLMESVGAGLGSWITGVLFDTFGNYQVAFTALAVMVGIALLLSTQVRSEVDERALMQRA